MLIIKKKLYAFYYILQKQIKLMFHLFDHYDIFIEKKYTLSDQLKIF